MKSSTLLFGVTALTSVLASPTTAAITKTTTNTTLHTNDGDATNAIVSAGSDCKDCDDKYKKCIASFWCWFNPDGCYISCNKETCNSDIGGPGFCRNQCGYNKYC